MKEPGHRRELHPVADVADGRHAGAALRQEDLDLSICWHPHTSGDCSGRRPPIGLGRRAR